MMPFIATDPLYPFFSIFSFFSFFLPLVPLKWHLQAWNSGACFYMVWASLLGLINFVNSIVWAGKVLDVAPVWCDFSTHVFSAACYATPLCSLCIVRRLYLIASSKLVMTRIEKRRALIFDTVLSFIIPLVLSGSQYIVEGHRYDIFEEIGCWPHVYNTVPGLLFVNLPAILTGLVTAVYGVLCLHAIFRHLQELEEFYTSVSASTFTTDRFIPMSSEWALRARCRGMSCPCHSAGEDLTVP
jgi:pheromone a factor receptor